MTASNRRRIDALVSLLDDEDKVVATAAMAELLTLEEEGLPDVLRSLQEAPNPLLRRRLHQISSILRIRRRRAALARRLNTDGCDLLRGLADLHLQWYDNDGEDWMEADWRQLLEDASQYRPRTSRRVAQFMADAGFQASPRGELDADFLCLGIVIEDRVGADVILCALAFLVGASFGWRGAVVRVEEGFALLDSYDHLVFPGDWRVEHRNHRRYEVWSRGMILRHAAYMLFLCAVATVSVSYAFSIGKCLLEEESAAPGGVSQPGAPWNAVLPYPYDGGPPEDGSRRGQRPEDVDLI